MYLDDLGDLASCKVELDRVVYFDRWIRIADSNVTYVSVSCSFIQAESND